jgi:hypothetical protein
MQVAEIFQAIQAFAAFMGMVFAALAYWKGRQNLTSLTQAAVKIDETHALVNSQGDKIEAAARASGYREGVIDQAGGAAPGPYPPSRPPTSKLEP